jgi:hypothetical protein
MFEAKEKESIMSYELIGQVKVIDLTKDVAKKFRDMDGVPSDRNLSVPRIEAYRKIARAGLFRPLQWATAFCVETNGTYRVNGKHTSTLFAEDDVAIPQGLVAVVEHFKCDTMEDLAKLYSGYDSRSMVRTTNDINKSFAAVDEDLAEIPVSIVSLCVTAIAYTKYGASYSGRPAAERAEALFDLQNKQFVRWVADMVIGEDSRHIKRSPVVSAMYDTWRKSHRAATDFWSAVRDHSGESPSLPDRKIGKYLLTRTVNTGNGGRKNMGGSACTPREMYVKCLHAWNAWRRNTTTDLKYHSEGKIPAVV